MGGIEIIGTGGLAITIGPEVRGGSKIRGRPPMGMVVSLKAKVKIRGGRTPMIDPVGKVYKDSECAFKNRWAIAS